ncbi:hypothetical protein SAMN02910456_01834 [Ruminococcaceae bacterium YRB3002]|nr:hypothetical protein SAMN02910456_01834 [Ruminococcaceae bacterium YRB3002]
MMLLNFFKMELFRLLKMKSLIATAVIMAFCVFAYSFIILGLNVGGIFGNLVMNTVDQDDIYVNYDMDDTEDYDVFGGTEDDGSDTYQTQQQQDFSIVGEGIGYDNDVATTFQMNTAGLIGLLLISIVAGLFFGNDYSTHINKNYPIVNGRKWVGFTSKILAMMIFIMAFHIFVWICCFISHLFWARSANPGIYPASVVYFFVTYMVTLTIVTMIGFVTTLFKSKAAGVTFGVMVSIGTFSLPVRIADFIIQWKTGEQDFTLQHYIPSRILANLNLTTDSKIVIIGAICAIIYFISAYMGSILITNKRDLDT